MNINKSKRLIRRDKAKLKLIDDYSILIMITYAMPPIKNYLVSKDKR